MSDAQLYLYDEIMLLALRDEQGTVPLAASGYPYAIGAALLAELLLAKRIQIVLDGEKHWVEASDQSSTIDPPLLQECLDLVRKTKRTDLDHWVTLMSDVPKLKHRIASGLCDQGILRAADKRVLLAFKRRTYPEVNHDPERELIEKLELAIFDDNSSPTPRTAALIAIADSVELLAIPFAGRLDEARRKRIRTLSTGQLYADASRAAFEPIATIAHAVSSNVLVFRN